MRSSTKQPTAPTLRSRYRIRRLRRLIGPLVFWGTTLTIAVISARFIGPQFEPESTFGPSENIAIATGNLEAGEKITRANATVRALPNAAVPSDAVKTVESLVGKRLTRSVAAGRPILARDVTGLANSSLAAKVGPGYRGVMVDLPGIPLKVSSGDHVDLLIARDGDGLAEMAVADAVVIDRLETGVLLKIPEAQLANLAGALVRGRPLLAIRGG